MENIKGIISSVQQPYPYLVKVGDKQFWSIFQFRAGAKIDVDIRHGLFSHINHRHGFIHVTPKNTIYPLSNLHVQGLESGVGIKTRVPARCLPALRSKWPVEWTEVQNFYTYHYFALFHKGAQTLVTNCPTELTPQKKHPTNKFYEK